MFKSIINMLAGNPYERELSRFKEIVAETADHGTTVEQMSDEELRTQTDIFRERIAAHIEGIEGEEELKEATQEILDEILPEAFAVVREAAWRSLGMRHYDVQVIGGFVLHEGSVAEMRTGEGKTLVATLPAYLNALTGGGVHVVTVNDYLARRDGGWMGPVYHALGLTVGAIGKERFSAIFNPDYVDPGGDLEDERLVHWQPTLRSECYEADVTYGTASEFGFDYLRDHTVTDLGKTVQKEHYYAIVDEVDSVLVDSARTPLIISGPADKASSDYKRFAEIVERARFRKNTTDLDEEEPDGDYIFDDRTRSISLTDLGIEKVERSLPEINAEAGQSLYDPQFYDYVHYLENALKAKYVFKRDKDYIIANNAVVLIDQTTGRPMPSRRYSEGLHQAIEAKEGVRIRREDQTLATITVQNYFRHYDKLSGMTGTAVTQAEEFDEVYKLDVIPIPTNVEYKAAEGDLETEEYKDEGVPVVTYYKPDSDHEQPDFFKRTDYPDQVYVNINGKFSAVADEIAELVNTGRPILVGTGSVEASEELSKRLNMLGVEHETLNAKNHQREASIVAQAGRRSSVTISTSMAGRGTDILLGGNPEGLASKELAKRLFSKQQFEMVVTEVVNGDLGAAKGRAQRETSMDETIVPWIVEASEDLQRRAQVEDLLGEVTREMQEEEAYQDIPFEVLTRLIREVDLGLMVSRTRLDKARAIVEENNLSSSVISDIEFRLNDYRQLSGLMGQNGQVDVLTRRLYERHYNARAALIRAVLSDDLEEAQAICERVPCLPASLIDVVEGIRQECRAARGEVWQLGGLHVIGTERHESRRIDDQLRGRAARQGDPGSSRFYLSLEDDLMKRFGGERTKKMMDRLNVPDDMPIAANILSNVIENAQSKFETYNFEVRKNLVEYDEAVNKQREIVYDERTAILKGNDDELDALVRQFVKDTLQRLLDRYDANYEEWAMGEVDNAISDFSNIETGEVNTRAVIQRTLTLIPRPDAEDLQYLLSLRSADELYNEMRERVLDGIDEGYNIRILYAEIARTVPLWPVAPRINANGAEAWEPFVKRVRQRFDKYCAGVIEGEVVEEIWQESKEGLDKAARNLISNIRSGDLKSKEVEAKFYADLQRPLIRAFSDVMTELEDEELIDVILERVDELLAITRMEPVSNASMKNIAEDDVWPLDQQVFAIGADQIASYERALMLSVIDGEWRQYLTAIDGLRQGIGLEAYGQKDPKVEFKRRAFDMFDRLRVDVQENIARRFFKELSQHRQVIENQQRQEAMLDQLSLQGYRVKKQVSRTNSGQRKVTQTVEKDMWSKVGRNDMCPCGSGKKFKDCHYQEIQKQKQAAAAASTSTASGGGRSSRSRKRRRRRK